MIIAALPSARKSDGARLGGGSEPAARAGRPAPSGVTQPVGDQGDGELIDAARAWQAQDPDPVTRDELEQLIADADAGADAAIAALHDRFDARLEFGTAGLRGAIGAGPNRMNRVLVSQAAAGLAAWLTARARSEDAPSVVIGYDGRTNSDVFAIDTAEIIAGAGLRAILLPRMLPTPALAFAVRHLGTSAGVMVTASHNPAADNGYKVYLGGDDQGAQINAPVDAEIAERIHAVASGATVTELPRSTEYEIAGADVADEYIDRTASLARTVSEPIASAPAPSAAVPPTAAPPTAAPSTAASSTTAPSTAVPPTTAPPTAAPSTAVPFTYTAMHGVGWETASRVFDRAGFGVPVSVAEQQHPDAAFPTVAFPNPEEPGALDLAYRTATAAGSQLIIANDPDADRLAVAIPDGDGWRRLTGNEVGSLLGWRAAERIVAAGPDGTLAASLVSSPALRAVAAEYRLDFVETLTGFKWISRAGGLRFGYEEALGYLVDPDKVRDKDGISAAVDFLAMTAELAASGRTIDDHLVAFAERFGGYASAQISVRVSDLAEIPRTMQRLRATPPTAIGSRSVARMEDFAGGFGTFGPSDILRIFTDDGARVIIRPSGTEPKVKVYIDASSTDGSGHERLAAAQAVVDDLDAGVRTLLA